MRKGVPGYGTIGFTNNKNKMFLLNQLCYSLCVKMTTHTTAIIHYYPVCVAGQFFPAPPTCPGRTITFRCTVNGSGTTIWRVGGSSDLCTLAHVSTSSDSCGPSGRNDAFTASPEAGFGLTSATSFTSTLSGTATPVLNGTLVECFGPASSLYTGNRIADSTINVLGW